MKIVVGSTSAVKLNAIKGALSENCIHTDVVGVKASSGINEQPFNEETLLGARNRAAHARQIDPEADLYISIENGVFDQGGAFFDKAVVLAVTADGTEYVEYSSPVQFPADMIEIAREKGFQTTTVGSVMQEKGLVKDHTDPHFDLTGKSRADILQETVSSLLRTMKGRGPSPTPKLKLPTPSGR